MCSSDLKIRVFAVLMNIDGLGDMAANEVDRDALADRKSVV